MPYHGDHTINPEGNYGPVPWAQRGQGAPDDSFRCQTHGDAIADTHKGYTAVKDPKGWEIRCLWCRWLEVHRLKRDAIASYRVHERANFDTPRTR